jgi:DNA-binding NarL/FixJ family response regulator
MDSAPRTRSANFLGRVLPTLCEFFALMDRLIVDDAGHSVCNSSQQSFRTPGTARGDAWSAVSTQTTMTAHDERTHQIMELLREGRSDTRIAKRLGISRDEVRAVIHQVIAAARLDDQARLAALADQLGLSRTDN